MGNCLVTKLKENVANDNLNKMGVFKFKVITNENAVSSNATINIKKANNTSRIYNRAGELVKDFSTSQSAFSCANDEEYTVEMPDKYSFLHIFYGGMPGLVNLIANIDELKYSELEVGSNTGIFILIAEGITGNINSLDWYWNVKKTILIGGSKISGTTTDIKNYSFASELTEVNLANTNISGNISELSNLTALTELRFAYSLITYKQGLKKFLDDMAVNRSNGDSLFMVLPADYIGNDAGITKYNPTITFDGVGGWTWA